MPTVIDSLVVRLGLDSKDLDAKSGSAGKKLKEVEGQSAKTEAGVKKIGTASKEAAVGVGELTRTLGSFLALIGGTMAIKAFVSDFIDANAALLRLSQNLGLGVSTISAWGKASEELGGSAAGLQGTLDMLSKSQTELRLTGQSSLIPYFSALGVSLADVNGKARPVDAILLDLADRFSRMDRTTANNMGRMMGIDQGTMNLLLQGRKELELTIKRQKESTAVTQKQAEAAQKLQTQIVETKQKFTALGNALMLEAAPALERLADLFLRLGNWVLDNKELVTDFLKVMAVGLGAIALITAPINLTVVAVLALAAGIALLWQDYQVWKRGGTSFIDWAKWEPEIRMATNAINGLKSAIDGVIDSYKSWYEKTTGHKFSVGNFIDDTKAILGIPISGGNKGGAADGAQIKPAGGGETLESAIARMEGFGVNASNRPTRNHNPGDLEYGTFAKSHGATGSDGRFAIFPDDETGKKALYALLRTSEYSKLTVEQAVNRFAPPNENNTKGYVASVTASTGLKASDLLSGIQGASGPVAGAGTGAGSSSTSTTDSRSLHIGEVKIYTAATDASGIAADMSKSMDFLFTSQANAGLN